MSHPFIKTACVVAGFAVAALAATSAHAAKPLSVKQKNEMAEAKARQNENKPKAALRTSGKTTLRTAGGGVVADVPVELDNYLTAMPDAKGRMHVRDIDPNAPATATTAGVTDEK